MKGTLKDFWTFLKEGWMSGINACSTTDRNGLHLGALADLEMSIHFLCGEKVLRLHCFLKCTQAGEIAQQSVCYRVPTFVSQHPNSSSQVTITPVLGDPLSGLHALHAYIQSECHI